MRIVFISDTHNQHEKLTIPEADLLIHAGDISNMGYQHDFIEFNEWLGKQPVTHKVVIAGNHDLGLQQYADFKDLFTNAVYLEDAEVEIEGLRIYGSPWTPKFYSWAFMRERGPDMKKVWDNIPEGLDILVTHGPPHLVLDTNKRGISCGCEELKEAIRRTKPKISCHGHIHEARGTLEQEGTFFINAAICGAPGEPLREPMVFDLFE